MILDDSLYVALVDMYAQSSKHVPDRRRNALYDCSECVRGYDDRTLTQNFFNLVILLRVIDVVMVVIRVRVVHDRLGGGKALGNPHNRQMLKNLHSVSVTGRMTPMTPVCLPRRLRNCM